MVSPITGRVFAGDVNLAFMAGVILCNVPELSQDPTLDNPLDGSPVMVLPSPDAAAPDV
jgi:hypothetical protein